MKRDQIHELPGAFVISLDFELHWGVRDNPGQSGYVRHLHGARKAVPRVLDLFREFDVGATWAVVGFLFGTSRDDLEQVIPRVTPTYRDRSLSPYDEPLGENEEEDPLRYAPSLISLVQATPHQEVATHTFSHYYCLEEGQDGEMFRADLEAAKAIAARRGIRLRSIVFPRNQHNLDYDRILTDADIHAYRGNPRSVLWQFGDGRDSRALWKRAGRLLDAYGGRQSRGPIPWTEVQGENGLSNVRASALLSPYRPRLRYFEPLRLARICRSLRFAARRRRIFHLWWHPHNFGVHQDENFAFLRRVLEEFASLRETHGMRSLTMAEVDELVRRSDASDEPVAARGASAT